MLSPELLSRWNNSSLHSDLGWFLYVGRRFDEAVDEFEEARQLNPGTAGPLIDLGNVLINSHKLDKASEIYRKAIELDEEAAGTVVGLANVMVEQHKYLEAEVQYRRAISLDQTIACPARRSCHALGTTKEDCRSRGRVTESGSSRPDRCSGIDGLRNATDNWRRRPREAETQFRKAMHIDPTDGAPHVLLGSLFVKKQMLTDAGAEFNEAAGLDPSDAFTPHRTYRSAGDCKISWMRRRRNTAKQSASTRLSSRATLPTRPLSLTLANGSTRSMCCAEALIWTRLTNQSDRCSASH